MRISDWSSDVCSSDLFRHIARDGGYSVYPCTTNGCPSAQRDLERQSRIWPQRERGFTPLDRHNPLQPEVPKISPFLQSCPCAMAASALSYCPSCCRIKKIQQSPIFLVQFQRSSVSIMSSCKSNNRFVGEVRSEEQTSELQSLMRNS